MLGKKLVGKNSHEAALTIHGLGRLNVPTQEKIESPEMITMHGTNIPGKKSTRVKLQF